jgi:hypothetical protein
VAKQEKTKGKQIKSELSVSLDVFDNTNEVR